MLRRERREFYELGILASILQSIHKGDCANIQVVTTAAGDPHDYYIDYEEGFGKLGCTGVRHLSIRTRGQADEEETLKQLSEADCVLFTGGDQLRLSSTFGGTRFLDILKDRYRNEQFVVAGTSAGAMVMSNPMIYEGRAHLANLKGEVKIVSGLGFVDDVIIDTHFDKRGRFSRLAQAVAAQPGALGIGLGEDTGVVITKGHLLEAIGSSSVILIDGKKIAATSIAEIAEGKPITVQGLEVHIMAAGDHYNIRSREFSAGFLEE